MTASHPKELDAPSLLTSMIGAVLLAEALAYNSTLVRLDLRGNQIGLAGIVAFR